MNLKKVENFISPQEAETIIAFSSFNPVYTIENEHIKSVNDETAGWSIMCDLTKSNLSKAISKFQGDGTLIESVPSIFHDLSHRIANVLAINQDHVFFQYIVLGINGMVRKHYDAGVPGFITYKCNICVDGPDKDSIYIDDSVINLTKFDLYAFEANLYKHWMDRSDVRRIHLSYGFMLPYDELGWNQDNPRVRLSNKLYDRYMKKNIALT